MRSLKQSSGTVRKVMGSVASGLFACVGLAGATAFAQSDPGAEKVLPGEEAHIRDAYFHALPQPSLKKMSTVDKLEAIEEIRLLPYRWARCWTQRDLECLSGLYAPDYYYMDGKSRGRGAEGMLAIMRRAGELDRNFTLVQLYSTEIEVLSPTTARGVSAANFHHYNLPVSGQPVVQGETLAGIRPGQEDFVLTYYYQTYEKHNGKWLIKTLDHGDYDLRRELNTNIQINESRFSPAKPSQ